VLFHLSLYYTPQIYALVVELEEEQDARPLQYLSFCRSERRKRRITETYGYNSPTNGTKGQTDGLTYLRRATLRQML
jgi:hypothetical protein